MTVPTGSYLLLHGTRAECLSDILAGGFLRSNSAVFTVSCAPRSRARLHFTAALAVFHAIGVRGWNALAAAQVNPQERIAIVLAEASVSQEPVARDHYLEVGVARPRMSFPYARIGSLGPITFSRAFITTIPLATTQTLLAPGDMREAPRFFLSVHRPAERMAPVRTGAACAAIADLLLEKWTSRPSSESFELNCPMPLREPLDG